MRRGKWHNIGWSEVCFLRPVMIEAVRRDMGLDTLQSHRDSEIYNL